MKNLIFGVILMFGISCSKSNDPEPIKYNSIYGTWQIENNGVTITFDVILVKNPSPPFDPQTDSIFTANGKVTYMGKTGYPQFSNFMNKVNYLNGSYTFNIWTAIGTCPDCAVNGSQLASFYPNNTFTEMTAHQADTNDINFYYFGSWVSVAYFNGSPSPPIILKEPLILKRIKGH